MSGKRAGKVADEKPSKRSKENCGKSSQANTPNKARGKVQVGGCAVFVRDDVTPAVDARGYGFRPARGVRSLV